MKNMIVNTFTLNVKVFYYLNFICIYCNVLLFKLGFEYCHFWSASLICTDNEIN